MVKAEQYSAYSESVESDHKFFFKAFAFSKDSNKIAMTCQIRMCLIGEEGMKNIYLFVYSHIFRL